MASRRDHRLTSVRNGHWPWSRKKLLAETLAMDAILPRRVELSDRANLDFEDLAREIVEDAARGVTRVPRRIRCVLRQDLEPPSGGRHEGPPAEEAESPEVTTPGMFRSFRLRGRSVPVMPWLQPKPRSAWE
uniref:Uncharacterized protein n=1 Tax=Pyrodinium bahamense TaxID=73915 RepID=A0A7S0FLD1_9DINO